MSQADLLPASDNSDESAVEKAVHEYLDEIHRDPVYRNRFAMALFRFASGRKLNADLLAEIYANAFWKAVRKAWKFMGLVLPAYENETHQQNRERVFAWLIAIAGREYRYACVLA